MEKDAETPPRARLPVPATAAFDRDDDGVAVHDVRAHGAEEVRSGVWFAVPDVLFAGRFDETGGFRFELVAGQAVVEDAGKGSGR